MFLRNLIIIAICITLFLLSPSILRGETTASEGQCCTVENAGVRPHAENSLSGFFTHLFDTSSYPARWNCGSWTSMEGWLHVVSDIGIFVAYFAIPLALVYFIRKRKDVPFYGIFILFAAFILCCGTGHLLEAVIFWYPIYRIAGLLKLTTAIVSLVTVFVLLRLLPKLMELPSLISRNESLREADALKNEFLANMSHEIRTPMTAILGYSDVLLDESTTEDERKTAVKTIQKNGTHLLELINDILDLSKIEAGKLDIELQSVRPALVVRDVLELVHIRAEERGNTLSCEIDGEIPATITTDSVRLKQSLLNLVGNAVKFTENGSIRVVMKYLPEAEQLQFDVIDTGIGMTPEQLGKIFSQFGQADSSTTRLYGGTGLGLTITKRIAELLGGEVSVKSEAEKGSQFTLNISTGTIQDVPMISTIGGQETYQKKQVTSDNLPEIKGDVLVVEDGPYNQRLVSFILKKAGANVFLAENGEEGFEAAMEAWKDRNPYGVILMDMQMPVMDGYTATKLLREAGYPFPIIALTAHAMIQDIEKCLDAGCDHYLSKPIDRSEFLNTIASCIGKPSEQMKNPVEKN